ncbi:MAG: DMT family transporter [Elusimicrobiota bacterium]|nr:DMT family transporter [Elusimicrobiota bacterium]
MDTAKKNSWLYFQVVFAAVVWGGSFPFTKHLVTELSPLSIVTFRALLGALLLLPLSGSKLRAADFRPGFLWKLALMSLLGVSAQQYLQAYALKYTQASHAGWLIASTPIVVAGFMAALGEKIGAFKAAAFLLGAAGAMLVVFSRSGGGAFALPSTRGDLIFLSTCVSWAFYVILTKKWLTFWPQAKVTTMTMLVALATLLPVWLLSGGGSEVAALTPEGWFSLAYLGLLCSSLGYLFWNNSVEGLGPVKASYFLYLEPFATLLSAYLFLGEKASSSAFAGGMLILAGVYLVGLKENKAGSLKGISTHA